MNRAGRAAILVAMLMGETMVAAFVQSPDDNRILCKREAVTATRLPQPRTCRTMAAWRELEKQRDRERNLDGQNLRSDEIGSQPPRPPSPQ